MIYIFKGCSGCCELPFKVCDECGKACGQACGDICKPFQKCCVEIGKTVNGIFTRPLGVYVLGTIVVMVFQVVGVMLSLRHASPELTSTYEEVVTTTIAPFLAPTVTTSIPQAPPRLLQTPLNPPSEELMVCAHGKIVFLLILVEGLIALINIGCAVYIQHQTWEGLQDIVDMEEAEAAVTGQRAKRRNVAMLILDSSGKIFCYDVCFCFYFFFLIFELVLGGYGISLTSSSNPFCNPSGWPATVMSIGLSYPILVLCFAIGWVILLQCHSLAEDCCRPCGGFQCCFGKRPQPRTSTGADSSDEEYYYDSRPTPMQMVPGRPVQDTSPPSRKCCCCCIPVPHF